MTWYLRLEMYAGESDDISLLAMAGMRLVVSVVRDTCEYGRVSRSYCFLMWESKTYHFVDKAQV
jgi:hypothetical protein